MSKILTYTGKLIDPFNMCEDDICIEDIAHSLSNQCRFLGHTNHFYSIAEHCIRVSEHVPDELRLQGLLHDSTETYMCDIPGPWKSFVTVHKCSYNYWEEELLKLIFEALDISFTTIFTELDPIVRRADSRVLSTEARDLMPKHSVWEFYPEPYPEKIMGWFPEKAEQEFLKRYKELRCITSI